jgi:hypothetical protein
MVEAGEINEIQKVELYVKIKKDNQWLSIQIKHVWFERPLLATSLKEEFILYYIISFIGNTTISFSVSEKTL